MSTNLHELLFPIPMATGNINVKNYKFAILSNSNFALKEPFSTAFLYQQIAVLVFLNFSFGMKSERNRNFEAGIFTDEPTLVNSAIEQFDEVWIGSYCKQCGRKDVCKDPIAQSEIKERFICQSFLPLPGSKAYDAQHPPC